MLQIESDTQADAIYIKIYDKSVAYTEELDANRNVDYAEDGTPVGIDLLGVSEVFNVSGLPIDHNILDECIEILGSEQEFEQPAAISSYLRDNPFLLGFLLEAPKKIRDHFGPYTSLTLDILADREGDGSQELFILIGTDVPPDEALARLEVLDQEWWLEISSRTGCRLNIDLRCLDTTNDGGI